MVLSSRSPVTKLTYEHGILNEPILVQICTSDPRRKGTKWLALGIRR